MRFCEREFIDTTTLVAHQKAKHYTCTQCSKKLNSVAGVFTFDRADSGLQEHMKSIHRSTLDAIPGAVAHRMNPANAPEGNANDGIQATDLQSFLARVRTTSLPQPTTTATKKPEVKKVKVEAPLDKETIQAQLAEFQKKKELEEVDSLRKRGVALPPGLSTHE